MKFKYYLRGIGIGIVFASIIFLIAYNENVPSKMSNDEIINRAKELGMVEADDPINKLIDKKSTEAKASEEKESTEAKASEEKESTESKVPEEKESTETEADTTENKTTESVSTEDTATESNQDNNTENVANSDDDNTPIVITVDKGASSYPVCQKLQELGIIDDAAKFDDYLVDNGYANRISVGAHKLTKGMDYHTIAELISDPLD